MTFEDTRRTPRLPLRAAFVVAACSLVFVFAAAGTPIPLYNTYRAQDGAPMVGIPIGALACGALVHYGPAPRAVIYEITAAVLVVCIVLIARSPETMSRSRGAIASLRPRFQVRAGSGRLVLAAGAAFVATWSLGGFYQAFGPSVTAEYLRTTNPLVAAAVFSSVMVLNPIGGPLSGRLSPAAAVRAGMIAFVFAVVGIVASLRAGAIVPFIAASLVVGVAQGAASTGGIRALLADAGQQERAGLLSTIYLISYSGAAIPGMIAGKLTNTFDLFEIALGYAALGIVASALAMLAVRNPVHARRASDGAAPPIHEPPP